MLPPSSSLSGAAPRAAPGWSLPAIPRRFARFSSRFALRISTCCSSRRRRSSSGLKALFALNVVRRCSGMYLSAMVATSGANLEGRLGEERPGGVVWRGFICSRGAGEVKRRKRQERACASPCLDGALAQTSWSPNNHRDRASFTFEPAAHAVPPLLRVCE